MGSRATTLREQSMNAVVQRAEPASEATALIQVIERAATNPNVDIDKMERLLQMQERILERNAKAAYTTALAEMLPKLPVITERGAIKTRDGGIQSKYALWEDINEAIGPILASHGFALTFRTGSEANLIKVTGVLSHREGHSEETTISLPADTSGSKNAVQAVASSVSYGKRYTAGALLNITSRGEDDDGRRAGAGATLSEDQVANLEALITEVKADRARFLRHIKVRSLDEILAKNYTAVVKMLEAKRGRE
jgi:hypothetical protein